MKMMKKKMMKKMMMMIEVEKEENNKTTVKDKDKWVECLVVRRMRPDMIMDRVKLEEGEKQLVREG